MGKKRKAPPARERAEPAPNLFERLSNKKRFEILGRKVKGETRNVGRLRTAAAEKRKNTLLVEYKQLRKSNAFIDRRFGEDDESLTAVEKALLRFQKQRLREMAGGKFTLPDEGEEEGGEGLGGGSEQLTHLGRALAELQDIKQGWASDDDDDAALNEELTRDLHFGGGLFERKRSGGAGAGGEEGAEEGEGAEVDEDGQPRKRSKKEVMEEVIAKSKAYKAMKAQQREADLGQTEELDSQFKALLAGSGLLGMMRPKGVKRDSKPDTEDDRAFDVLTRELVYEAKAQPGDRTLSAEELAEQERQRLEALERQRLRRQRGEGASDTEEEEEEQGQDGAAAAAAAAPGRKEPAGGFAARRAKRRREEEGLSSEEEDGGRGGRGRAGGPSGDALEDDFELGGGSSEDEEGGSDSSESGSEGKGGEGLTALERRRRERAAGSHPLQESFKAASARLLAKYGVEAANKPEAEEDGEESEEEGEEEEEVAVSGSESEEAVSSGEDDEGGSGSSSEEEEGGSEGSDREEEEEGGEEEPEPAARPTQQKRPQLQPAAPAEAQQAQQATEAAAPAQQQQQQQQQGKPSPAEAAAAAAQGFSANLPFTPPLPATYPELAALAEGLSPADLGELIRRMRVFHAAELSTGSRKKAQLLYGLLVQHFASLAAPAGDAGALPLAHLDALLPHLLEMTQQVPFYAATLARARLTKAQQRLAAALHDPLARADAWPPARTLLLLKLLATVFPPSDKRHAVLTPAGLLACSYLANCPLARPRQVAVGLFLASMALHLHSQARRFVPEPLNFAVSLLSSALPAAQQRALRLAGGSNMADETEEEPASWLRVSAAEAASASLPASAEDIAPLDLATALGSGGSGAGDDTSFWTTPGFKVSATAAAVRLIGRAAEVFGDLAPLPEVLAPAQRLLRALVAAAAAAETPLPPAAAAPVKGKGSKRSKALAGDTPPAAAADAVDSAVIAPGLAQLCKSTLEQLDAAAAAAASRRRPLVNTALLKLPEARQFNPRFEEGYAAGKDYDPDRERSERRKLQRQLRSEERGAVRELRKDAAFMAGVRDREKAARQSELEASERRAKSFLQEQASDFKSGGQKGMNWKKGFLKKVKG